MTNGIFLGGFAEGQRNADVQSNREAVIGLQRDQLNQSQENTLETRRIKAINDTAQLAQEAAEKIRASGRTPPPDMIENFAKELQGLGANPAQIDALRQTMSLGPVQPEDPIEQARVRGQAAAAEKLAEQEALGQTPEGGGQPDEIFGVPVPPVVENINDFDAPVQRAFFDAQKKATATQQLLDELEIFKRLIATAQTGKITALTLPVVQFFKEAGIQLRQDDDISALEAIQAGQNQLALRLRNPESGFGLTGNTSDRDVQFLKDAVGGLQNTKEGNRAAVMVQIAKMRREADLAAIRSELLARGVPQLFNKVKEAFIEQTPLFTEEEEAFLSTLGGGEDDRPTDQLSDDDLKAQLGIQ